MRTLIFDIDGTLTNMWPLERAVLQAMGARADKLERLHTSGVNELVRLYAMSSDDRLAKLAFRERYQQVFMRLREQQKLPKPAPYPSVDFILSYGLSFRLIYATGGTAVEAAYVLDAFCIKGLFDAVNSISADNCRFAKSTGIPFRRLKRLFTDCVVITDSDRDCAGAEKAGLPALLVNSATNLEAELIDD